jgi:hypothetical protein
MPVDIEQHADSAIPQSVIPDPARLGKADNRTNAAADAAVLAMTPSE